jgi:hypothetical protein
LKEIEPCGPMVVDAGGQIGNVIELRDHAAKRAAVG